MAGLGERRRRGGGGRGGHGEVWFVVVVGGGETKCVGEEIIVGEGRNDVEGVHRRLKHSSESDERWRGGFNACCPCRSSTTKPSIRFPRSRHDVSRSRHVVRWAPKGSTCLEKKEKRGGNRSARVSSFSSRSCSFSTVQNCGDWKSTLTIVIIVVSFVKFASRSVQGRRDEFKVSFMPKAQQPSSVCPSSSIPLLPSIQTTSKKNAYL